MKVVRTFSTSANLGPGFDTLGICFNIYNEYYFYKNDKYDLVGFDEQYQSEKFNLIISSYEYVFKKLNKQIVYLYLEQLTQNIPNSRGLGSSASCIVAGVMIANDILGKLFSKDEMFQICSEIEGHPDNVAPLIYGGLTCSFKDDKYYKVDFKVHESYKFMVCIPPFELKTSLARSVLPKQVSISDAVFNVSHALTMVKALECGDIELLKKGKKDLFHEPYRYPLIKDSEIVLKYATDNNLVCLISGAGSTLLLIGKNKISQNLILDSWRFEEVELNKIGAYIYEK